MPNSRQPHLGTVLAPASIAIVGASTDPTRIGSRVLANLRAHGYAGELSVVSPRHSEIAGLPCHRTLASLGSVPDLLLLAVGADTTLTLLAEFAGLGGKNAVLLASGFGTGEAGVRRSVRLAEIVSENDLNIVGPNTQGLWNVGHKMVLAFGSEASRDHIEPGPVSVIAHSGSLGGAITRRLLDLGVGISHFISTGDGTVTDTGDYVLEAIENPAVRVIALYVEGTRGAKRLCDALRVAHERGVGVVVLPGGMSAAGQAATSSHTGRIITRPRLFTQLLEQHGAFVVRTVRELVGACRVMATAPVRFEHSPNVALLGISGGMLALLVDSCEGRLRLAEFGEETLRRLEEVLPAFASYQNPVDVTGAVVEDETLLTEAVAAALSDPQVDALIVGMDNRGYERVIRHADHFSDSARRWAKPIIFSLWDAPADRNHDVERQLGHNGVYIADDPSAAVDPLLWMTRTPFVGTMAEVAPLQSTAPTATWTSWEGITRLAETLGMRVPRTWNVSTERGLPCGELDSPPYVVKPVPNAVAHKSDRGLVHLNLHTPDDVTTAARQIWDELGPGSPVLIQETVTGVELLVTVGRDPDWGQILTIGAGGKLVELLNEVVHLRLPCDEAAVRSALSQLGVHRLLEGYRDLPPADVDALVVTIDRLQRMFMTHRSEIDEIELNPVMVGETGQGVALVDLLVRQRISEGI